MTNENRHIQEFPTGEIREFEPDKTDEWKLTLYVKAPGQTSRAISRGTLMKNARARWSLEDE